MAMQLNVLVALTDIGPGDGCTMLIPGLRPHAAIGGHPCRPRVKKADPLELCFGGFP